MERSIFPSPVSGKTVTLGAPSMENSNLDNKWRDPRAQEKLEKLNVSIQYKKECFDRSKRIVEQLLERGVDEEYLLYNVRFISQSDYDDIVVERAIIKLCGYPICSNDLGPMPKKQFHISANKNKVYDITERKNYCSNWCYKASLYFKDQILSSPVWFRDHEIHGDYHLLEREGNSGKTGEEITMQVEFLNISEQKSRGERPTVSSFAFSELEQYQNDGTFAYDSLQINESFNHESSESGMEFEREPEIPKMPAEIPRQPATCGWANGGTVDLSQYEIPRAPKLQKMEPEQKEVAVEPKQEQVIETHIVSRKVPHRTGRLATNARPESVKFDSSKVVKFINEWFTIDTLLLILGPKKLHQRLRSKIDALSSEINDPDWKPTVESKLLQICKMMDEKDGVNKQPEDDRVACSDLEFKVAAFYKGRTSFSREPASREASSSGEVTPVLPIVDRYEQKQTRQKIILMRLEKVVPEIADILRIDIGDLGTKMKILTDTFELASHNIMMKPQEWNLMGLIVVQLLIASDHDPQRFVSKKSTKVLKAMLKSLNLEQDFLDQLIFGLCDIDRILAKAANS